MLTWKVLLSAAGLKLACGNLKWHDINVSRLILLIHMKWLLRVICLAGNFQLARVEKQQQQQQNTTYYCTKYVCNMDQGYNYLMISESWYRATCATHEAQSISNCSMIDVNGMENWHKLAQ